MLGFNLINLAWIIPSLAGLIFLLCKCFVNVGPRQFAIIERKYIGKSMKDGRTIALKGEVGIQARVLEPGLHFLIPFIEKVLEKPYVTSIGPDEFGYVEAITGLPMPSESSQVAASLRPRWSVTDSKTPVHSLQMVEKEDHNWKH